MRKSGLFNIIILSLLAFYLLSCGKPTPDIDPLSVKMNLTIEPEKWVKVPAGIFISELNEHKVNIDYDYEIMNTEVTYATYAKFLNEALAKKIIETKDGYAYGNYPGDKFNSGRHEKPVNKGKYKYFHFGGQKSRIKFENGNFVVVKGYEKFPATYVTWMGAWAFAKFYGWKLPKKIEWEKASRGTDGRSFPFVVEPTPERANYYHSGDPFDKANGTTPVGFYNGKTHGDFKTIDSPSPYGCYDMAGNAAEWMGDILEGSHLRLIYGGSMMQYGVDMRAYVENSSVPEYASFQVGFRCVR